LIIAPHGLLPILVGHGGVGAIIGMGEGSLLISGIILNVEWIVFRRRQSRITVIQQLG
jgi:hypothetical protein